MRSTAAHTLVAFGSLLFLLSVHDTASVGLMGTHLAYQAGFASTLAFPRLCSSRPRTSRAWLYCFLSATFVLRFVLSEWMFSVAQAACPTEHGCVVVLGFLCHIAAVEDLAVRASARIERNLDKVHQVAYLVWIKLGTPVGLLSALFVCVDSFRLAAVGSGPWCGLVVLTGGCVASFVCTFVRLLAFFKDLWFIMRVYTSLSHVEMHVDFGLTEACDLEDKEELMLDEV
ncbi:hypothetical protein BC830DRAFT_1112118 [Chytriomyces sp. MP71]|nr:hypothetical protein BC830DRAFT_1112118 [Chytriomyces sp. MP71]